MNKAERDSLLATNGNWFKFGRQALEDIFSYVDMLEDTLKFYAEYKGYPFSHNGKYAVVTDGGMRAREALERGK